MLIVYSHNGVPICLTDERWQHIVDRHVEMLDQKNHVLPGFDRDRVIFHKKAQLA